MADLMRYEILGAPVHAVDMSAALAWVARQVEMGSTPACVLAMNPEKVYHLRADPFFQAFFERAGLCIPDGIGVVLALRCLFGCAVSRVAGADLMQEICKQAASRGHRIFLFGASEEVNESSAAILLQRHPTLAIAGRAHGFLSRDEEAGLVARINASGAQILFVAMGSPRQESWVAAHQGLLEHVRVIQCIGGTLDTIDGRVKRAPRVFQRMGLEWFYRMLKQPSRIRRQVKCVQFAAEVALVWTRLRRR